MYLSALNHHPDCGLMNALNRMHHFDLRCCALRFLAKQKHASILLFLSNSSLRSTPIIQVYSSRCHIVNAEFRVSISQARPDPHIGEVHTMEPCYTTRIGDLHRPVIDRAIRAARGIIKVVDRITTCNTPDWVLPTLSGSPAQLNRLRRA